MNKKTHLSPKNKKILVGIGIGFGTIMVFLISFILSFSLIVNPINFMTISDDDTVEENKKLKEQVQTLEDEVDVLNTTVEKYKNSASASQKAPATTTVTESGQNQQPPQTQSHTNTPDKNDKPTTEQNTHENNSQPTQEHFAPETSTSTGQETPEDIDSPITVIDVSE